MDLLNLRVKICTEEKKIIRFLRRSYMSSEFSLGNLFICVDIGLVSIVLAALSHTVLNVSCTFPAPHARDSLGCNEMQMCQDMLISSAYKNLTKVLDVIFPNREFLFLLC